jgi:purine-binding chemotaxis protein CheW
MLYLLARMADRAVAISADQVESVVDIGPLVPVPGAPPAVEGLAALRSRVMTVIGSRAALGIADSAAPTPRAVVSVIDGHRYAILVDQLDDVAPFESSPLPSGIALGDRWASVARGLVDVDGEPVVAIDLRALVPGLSPVAAAA